MSNFTDEPALTLSNDGLSAKVDRPFLYHMGEFKSDKLVKVDNGFVTDGLTLPKYLAFLRPLAPRWAYIKAVLVHDVLCKKRYYTNSQLVKIKLTQKQIDDEFLIALKALGASNFRAHLYHKSVRFFQIIKRRSYV